MEQFPRGGGPPSNPRALACLVSRESELAFLFRSLIKRSPPSARHLHLGTRDPCRLHATASQACLLKSMIKLLSSSLLRPRRKQDVWWLSSTGQPGGACVFLLAHSDSHSGSASLDGDTPHNGPKDTKGICIQHIRHILLSEGRKHGFAPLALGCCSWALANLVTFT